ncbi:hypothetical protein V6N12_014148 [Hibiscus sabdariffa]|uniref:Pyruvate kinase n=1 Tax=Hibiscus sabdariffa TaxID=183260 RepID=A0ABR2DJA5_9ROSI
MMDTEGSEIRMDDLNGTESAKAEDGQIWTFTVRAFDPPLRPERTVTANYDCFAEDVKVGDELIVDGGMMRFVVIEKIGPDVICHCTDPGLLLPRANLTFWRDESLVRERNAMLPIIFSKDWLDIDFGIEEGVDFIAVSFVKSAEVIKTLKSYITAQSPGSQTAVVAKIESIGSLKNLKEIIQASDGAMLGRGDLGAQIPLEQVPSVQQEVVRLCRKLNKPVIIASQLLESMIEHPIPTRAEVADVSKAVAQQADALMLSSESAMGQFPDKALTVLTSVSLRLRTDSKRKNTGMQLTFPLFHLPRPLGSPRRYVIQLREWVSANKLKADAIFVYRKTGQTTSLLYRNRPDCPIYAFTPSASIRRSLILQWGLIPFCLDFSDVVESNLNRTFSLLKARGMIKTGDLAIVVSDIKQSIQAIKVP